ncbi:imidazolonepropionase-like domain-containing protein [Streptomyces fungicidicus]
MLTLHTADASPETAVLVDGAHIAAVGPYERLAAGRPDAPVGRWPRIRTPGRLNPNGPEKLVHS